MTGHMPEQGPVLRFFEVKVRDGQAETLLKKFSTTSADVVRNETGNQGYFFGRGILTDAGRLVFASLWKDLDAVRQRFGENWQASFLPDGYEDTIEEHSIRHVDLSGGWFVDDQASRKPGRNVDGSG